MEPLLEKKVTVNGNGHDMPVGFSKYGNKHLYSDTYGRSSILNADDLANIDELLANAKFIRKSAKSKPRKDKIERFYYYEAEVRGKKIYLNVAETDFKTKHGNIWHERFLNLSKRLDKLRNSFLKKDVTTTKVKARTIGMIKPPN